MKVTIANTLAYYYITEFARVVVMDSFFHPILIFASKEGAYPSGALVRLHSKGRLPDLPVNISL
jgi:hypothetical protein